jgi:hypothetical protein
MKIVYAMEEIPKELGPSIFLAGPTPRSNNPVPSWRPEALHRIRFLNFEGTVFVPEVEDGVWRELYDDQVNWEKEALYRSTVILFWVPRDIETMPAFTTNVEFGYWVAKDPSKIIYGRPNDAPKTKYLDWLLLSAVPESIIFDSLPIAIKSAVEKSLVKNFLNLCTTDRRL